MNMENIHTVSTRILVTTADSPKSGLLNNKSIEMIKPKPAIEVKALTTGRVLEVTSGTSWINSLPSKVILPSSTSHDASPIVTSEVTDFPHPDSPTTPIISPSFTERETECSASTGPSRVSKCTRRFRISNRFDTLLPPVLGIHYIPQSIT